MSEYKGHRNGGIFSSVIVIGILVSLNYFTSYSFTYIEIGACVVSTFVFSLFPDIDIKSTPSKMIYLVVFVVLIALYVQEMYQTANMIAIFAIFPQLTKHRGIFHSLYAAFIIPGYPLLLYNLHITLPPVQGVVYNITLEVAIAIYISGVIGYILI